MYPVGILVAAVPLHRIAERILAEVSFVVSESQKVGDKSGVSHVHVG